MAQLNLDDEAVEVAQGRMRVIEGLRAMARFLEAHPSVPLTAGPTFNVFVYDTDALAAIAREASWQKEYYGNYFTLTRDFGQYTQLHVNISREQVCERVVVGQREVPAREATVEDVIEWRCHGEPLLHGAA